MKPTCNIETAAESFDKEQLSTDTTEHKMETSKKKGSWITVQKKKYPERQVLREGNTGTGNIQVEEELEVRAAEPIVPPDPHYPPLATAVPAGASAVRRPATARAAAARILDAISIKQTFR
ncbi:unnamed protein product [Parnassius apollo]|uniref:(apollo) hypothetical protein n=1 Tax=Parnassius apollo TaxID=110799 RepID=A0A8S3XRH5_PARAO|nr:unnamed protein product [Parnassius apollo]